MKRSLFIEYILVVFILLWSGGLFTYGMFKAWPYILPFVTGFVFFKRKGHLDNGVIIFILLCTIIAFFQAIKFGGPVTSIAEPTLKMLTCAFIAYIIFPNFKRVFINVTCFFAITSLIFWVIDIMPFGHSTLLSIASSLPQLGAETYTEIADNGYHLGEMFSLYLYSVSSHASSGVYTLARNAGPFWEPGRFTIPLTIAIMMILFDENYRKSYRKRLTILLAANITTFSTAGFCVMFIVLFGFIFKSDKSFAVKFFASIFGAVCLLYVTGLSFMGDKIITASEATDVANSRFGAMFYHWTQIVGSPIIGYGAFLQKQYSYLELSPCGWTEMMRSWGIPFSILSWYLLYKGCKIYSPNNKRSQLFSWLAVMGLAFPQSIMTAPLFLTFYFFAFINSDNNA